MTGFLLDTDKKFKLIKLPVIAEEDENWTIYQPVTGLKKLIARHKGDVLHPERENWEIVRELQQSLGEYAFAGQYQQNPAPLGGGMIKKEWLRYYNVLPDLQRLILSWDTAGKNGEDNAFSACIALGVDYSGNYYLLESFRQRMNFPELVKMAVDIYFRYKNAYMALPEIVIEDASSGTQLLQVLRHDHALNPHAVKPNQDKVSRMQGTSLLIEQGKLLFPNTAGAWYKDFESELTTFPKSRFKDQCDALSQASDYLSSNASLVEPRIVPRTDYYLAGHRSIYKTHPMRDPRRLRKW